MILKRIEKDIIYLLTRYEKNDKQKAPPVLNNQGKWMTEQYMDVPQKSLVETALTYSINRRDKLS